MGLAVAAVVSVRRIGWADAAIGCACVVLLLTALAPRLERALIQRTVDALLADVEAARSTALATRLQSGSWPSATDVARAVAADTVIERAGYSVAWSTLERVERVRIPPPAGGDPRPVMDPPPVAVVRPLGVVTVRSASDALLGELLARYGPERSFVRDATWTLVVEAEPVAPVGAP